MIQPIGLAGRWAASRPPASDHTPMAADSAASPARPVTGSSGRPASRCRTNPETLAATGTGTDRFRLTEVPSMSVIDVDMVHAGRSQSVTDSVTEGHTQR